MQEYEYSEFVSEFCNQVKKVIQVIDAEIFDKAWLEKVRTQSTGIYLPYSIIFYNCLNFPAATYLRALNILPTFFSFFI